MTEQSPAPRTQRFLDETSGQPVHLIYAIPPELLTGAPDQAKDSIEMGESLDLRAFMARLWLARRQIIGTMLIGALLGAIIAFLQPIKYKSQVVALPPQAKSGMSQGMSQYAEFAAVAGVSLSSSGGSSVEEILAILDSRTMRQKLIADFNLKDYYHRAFDDDVLAIFSANFIAQHDKRTNRIIFTFTHTDPQVAADLCNAAAVALQGRFNEIHQSASRRERAFIEGRLQIAQQEAAVAAEHFAAFQRDNRTVELESQTKATVATIGTLQGQLIAEQVELRAMLASEVNADNPQVQLLQQKVDELGRAIARLNGDGDRDGVLLGLGRVPELGISYLNLFREVKRGEAMVASLTTQAEGERIAEVRNGEVISIIDSAVPAQRRFSPNRTNIALISTLLSGLFAVAWVFIWPSIGILLADMHSPKPT